MAIEIGGNVFSTRLIGADMTSSGAGDIIKIKRGTGKIDFGIVLSDTPDIIAKIEHSFNGVDFDDFDDFNDGNAMTTAQAYLLMPADSKQLAPYFRLRATITTGQIDEGTGTVACVV